MKKEKFIIFCALVFAIGIFYLPTIISAKNINKTKHCTGVYVGKDLTANGNILIGQVADEASSHWLNVIPSRTHKKDSTIKVGCNEKADLPGKMIEIPQVEETNKYITVRYSDWKGFPKPLENGGLNEHLVSMVTVFSPSRPELVKMTPKNQTGLSYSDEAKVVMQRAKTARQGVELIGKMIKKYGHATYGGNTHLIADPTEAWIIEEFAGGKGLWAARKLGASEYKVLRPGYMEEFPINYQSKKNYMGSENLISFAKKKDWYTSDSEGTFNISKTYEADRDKTGCWGEGRECKDRPGHQIRSKPVKMAENYLKKLGTDISKSDIMKLFRKKPIHNRGSKYAQLAELKKDKPKELSCLWIALGPIQESIFIPYYLGINEVPVEYREHRYLTKGEATKFMLPKSKEGQETTEYAFRAYDRLFMLVEEHPEEFREDIKKFIKAYEDNLLKEQNTIEKTAFSLYKSNNHKLAKEYLTRYSKGEAMKALEAVKTLNKALELRTKVLFNINTLKK